MTPGSHDAGSSSPIPNGQPGSADTPLRVAVVGAGPAGFYAADHLLKQDGLKRLEQHNANAYLAC